MDSLSLNNTYLTFLKEIKAELHRAQMRAALASNAHQIQFYWELGTDIIKKQTQQKWGAGFNTIVT